MPEYASSTEPEEAIEATAPETLEAAPPAECGETAEALEAAPEVVVPKSDFEQALDVFGADIEAVLALNAQLKPMKDELKTELALAVQEIQTQANEEIDAVAKTSANDEIKSVIISGVQAQVNSDVAQARSQLQVKEATLLADPRADADTKALIRATVRDVMTPQLRVEEARIASEAARKRPGMISNFTAALEDYRDGQDGPKNQVTRYADKVVEAAKREIDGLRTVAAVEGYLNGRGNTVMEGLNTVVDEEVDYLRNVAANQATASFGGRPATFNRKNSDPIPSVA